MTVQYVRDVVIAGGGTAGWMAAALFSRVLGGNCRIHLVESDEIGIVGVGEATIPHIRVFNELLGIDENDFLKHCQGSFKLGIEFVNWGRMGDRYTHGFGPVGSPLSGVAFHHYWLRQRATASVADLDAFSLNCSAPRAAKYVNAQPQMQGSPLADLSSAYHFDARLYAAYLRKYAEARGVRRTEGKIASVDIDPQAGHIRALVMDSGERIAGDFFIDCTGTRALLIEGALEAGYEDWRHWLPCDRALAVPCESVEPLIPLTRSTAHRSGWQWRIPLQHRIGNGHVYSSPYISDDEAASVLMNNLDGKPLGEPRLIKYVTGRRKTFWKKNCVAVGLASGFLEPLESTSIHLIQTAVMRILSNFPHLGFSQADIDHYNRETRLEYEGIRDFIITHYHVTERSDSPFWNYCRTMEIPDSLAQRLALFRSNGRVLRELFIQLFAESSWVQVLLGQHCIPEGWHPLAGLASAEELSAFIHDIEAVTQRCVAAMPTHADYIKSHCAAA
ncbi:MAG: tryptophan 7-halogenase [Burkholderiales bacterium]|nr:tryptophan 7-halogenase [Burkholderiales bacterium]